MYESIRFVGDLLVMALVAFPPFLYLYKYTIDKVKSLLMRLLIYGVYWGGTVLLSNLIPALVVLFLIYVSRKKKTMDANENQEEITVYEQRRFKLDCSSEKWKFSLRTFILFVILGFIIKVAVTYINLIVVAILQNFNIQLEGQEVVGEFLKSDILKSILFSAVIVIGAPIVEEFVFRFWIYDRILKPRVNSTLAAVFSNLLFMAAHFNVQGAVSFFLVGIINCAIYDRKGYWAAVTTHFMFNFISVIFLIVIKLYNIPLEV